MASTKTIKIASANRIFNVLTDVGVGKTVKLVGGKSKNSPSLVLEFTSGLRKTDSDTSGTEAYGVIKAGVRNNNSEITFRFKDRTVIVGKGLFGFAQKVDGTTYDTAAKWTTYLGSPTSNPDPAAPQTFTLTTGTNQGASFTGGSGDDTFDAGLSTGSLQTLNSGDRLNGGLGTDELVAVINTSVTPAALTSIENVQVTIVTNSATVDFTNATGLKTVSSAGSSGAGNTVTLSGLGTSASVAIKDTSMAHTITYNDVTGSSDAATVDVSNMSQATGVVTSILGIETLTLNATGASSSTATTGIGTLTATQTTKLNIKGDKGLRIVDDLAATILTVDASNNSGGVALILDANAATVTGGSGNDTIELDGTGAMSIVAGAGNDTIIFDSTVSNFTIADTVTGGDGNDTLSADSADLVTATAATPTTYTVTGIEKVDMLTALANATTIDISNLSLSANRLEVSVVSPDTAGAETYIFNAGASTLELDAQISLNGAQNVSVGGAATTDSLTIINGTTSATNVLNGLALTSTGFETLTIDTTGTGAAGAQTVGAIGITPTPGATPKLKITGSNQLTTGVITATDGSIDATGMSASAGTTGLIMVTGQNTASTITGSAGDDTLFGAITNALSQTIAGGAGNDAITAGSGNDILTGGDGNDTINGGAGNDNIDGGAGNDVVTIAANANLTAADTIVGGAGTDIISFEADMTDDAAIFGRISGFEVIRHSIADTITLSNFINNQDITQIEVNANVVVTFNNASEKVTTLQINATGSTTTVDRLVDDTTNAITVSIESGDGASAASLVLQDEETITFANARAGDNFTVTALTSTDAKNIIVTGAGNLISADAVTSGTAIASVNASAATGAVTFNAGNSAVKVTATGGSGVFTFTGGIIGDAITGGTAADVLAGGGGADTISGGAGADSITGGAGGDSMTGGSGVDTFVAAEAGASIAASSTSLTAALAVGDSLTFANGVDIITDFTAGTGGDRVDATGNGGAVPTSGLTLAVANGFAANTTYFLSGSFDTSTKQFTVLAAGTGADTAIVRGAGEALSANTSFVILIGVDSDDFVAANFI